MSMDLSEFYEVFFEECYEGLEVMEQGLLNLDVGDADVEAVNTIFRAAHSIKGGSATFDFNHIASFTHVMETLLDQMRSGERRVTVAAVDLLLESVDCLREMIDATRAEEPIDQARVDDLQQRLQAMLAQGDDGEAPDAPAPAAEPALERHGFRIRFVPNEDLLQSGNDPYRLLRELGRLGDMKVRCNLSRVPPLDKLDPTRSYLGWDIELEGDVEEEEIHELFAWVEGDCELVITPLSEAEGAPVAHTAPDTTPDTAQPEAPAEAPPAAAAPSEAEAGTGQGGAEAGDGQAGAAAAARPADKPRAPAAAKKPAKAKGKGGESSSIRVAIEKIDTLINLVGELVITQSMLGQFAEDFDMSQIEQLRDGLSQLSRNSRELQETAMQIRMLPISSAFNRFPRMIRDLSAKLGKKVELRITGENTELDKTVLEKITDPLVHLVRNSLDHGLETPEERRKVGKPETGVLELKAYHEGGNIVIEVVDDGAGLNTEKIKAKALEKGLIGPDDKLTEEEINNLIFQPGFSTADKVSDVSGRGVGMDVVRRNINDLGGQVYVTSERGKGSTLTIRLPLTLAIIDGQLVKVGSEVYVIPLLSIDESLQVNPDNINRYKGTLDLYKLREEYIPIINLPEMFDIEPNAKRLADGLLVVVQSERRRVGLFVDELLGQQQVVIKSLEKNFRKLQGFSGATILGDGTVSLIIDVPGLVRQHLQGASTPDPRTLAA